ncbi:SusC/RagA family TonB-linked outer membrane protein [Cellulophaga sp. HaHa_2_1]|uniref:SusC/RagA family TonB-linked outer membrane protein n=1 Tax=Cellulophaga sp. HaHa_2_1 TaxID=2749994 RepID=UPI001C4FA1EB|nr:SusC/RagA family TonB-linked outer membrane protein [Cellulophaga sp. HaHa_2_1]QXP54071.1 SusC/RagA family TonB-linked outer membrane protein [Cellulophaga sp. HaHa_2_1]
MKTKGNGILTLLLAFVVHLTFAQEKTISGTVTDQDGLPLPGVNIVAVGTTNGTQTDFDGNYSIKTSVGKTLLFTYVGQKDVKILVGSSPTINPQMTEDAQALTEVVVTAQGIKSNPRALSYAVQSVDSDDIEKSRETNLVSALSAKAAGVQVTTSSGSVGASANIRIRGNTSITRSNGPLFVVDGVPIDNSSSAEDPTQGGNSSLSGSDFSNRAIDINSNDIESVNILKGIAAQTLYGLRAANGVVLITTKKGRSGKTKVTLNTSTIISNYNKGPELQQVYSQGTHSGGVLTYRGPETFEGDSWGPKISDLEYDGDSSYPFDSNGALVPKGTGNGVAANAYDPYDFFKIGVATDINLSASGGNENINYRASIGRLRQEGISPNEAFERKTFRVDAQAKLNEKLTFDMSGQYTNSGGNRVQRGSNISGIMLGLLRNTPTFDIGNGLTGQAAADSPSSYFYTIPGSELPGQRSYRDGIYNNPYFTVARNKNLDNVNRTIGKMGLTYDVNEWLNFKSSASIDRYTDVRKIGFDIIDASFGNGRTINDVISNQDVNWNFLANATHDFNEDFGIVASIGYDGFYTKFNRQTVLGDGMTIPGFFNLSNVETTQAIESSNAKKLIGAFATTTLSYDNMIFITPAFRNDWSSTLPTGANTFQSYSIGGSFVFSELYNANNDSFINYGKLRGSWGKSGNDAPVYATLTNFGGTSVGGDGFIQSVDFPAYDTTSYERSATSGNPNLTPEVTKEFEVGIELSMLSSRLKLDVAYYDKETTDQILPVDAAPSSGFLSRFENVGRVSNKGYEVSLGGSPVRSENFSWNVDINWTTYENVVEELVDGVESITLNGFTSTSSRAVAGESYGALFGSRFARNDDGVVLIDDDGYPLQASEDGVVGDPIPDWTAGISNSFRYKNFNLSVLFDIRQGGDVWCGTCGIIDYFGTSSATLIRDQTTVFQGIVESTGAVNTQVVAYSDPSVSENNNYWRRYGFGGLSETAIYDASWVRLREVTLSYDFPAKWLENTFIEGISLSGFGRNLWLNTDYPGVDPETNLSGDSNGIGLDYFNQPNTESYGINLKLNF